MSAGRIGAVRANRALRLIVRRGGWMPSMLADPRRVDHVEVVEISSGEVVLFWDRSPQSATQLVRMLRAEMAELDVETFIDRWHPAQEA